MSNAQVKKYLDDLQDAITELRELSVHMGIETDMNGRFYVTGGRVTVRRADSPSIESSGGGAHDFNPIVAIQATLREWKGIKPPDHFNVDDRRMMWADNQWIDIT